MSSYQTEQVDNMFTFFLDKTTKIFLRLINFGGVQILLLSDTDFLHILYFEL